MAEENSTRMASQRLCIICRLAAHLKYIIKPKNKKIQRETYIGDKSQTHSKKRCYLNLYNGKHNFVSYKGGHNILPTKIVQIYIVYANKFAQVFSS